MLEDDPVFNAGRGAVLDERGFDRSTTRRSCAAPTAPRARSPRSRGIRNPVRAARAVLDEGRHVMLVGESAGALRPRGRARHRARGLVPHRGAPRRARRRRARRHRRRRRPRRAAAAWPRRPRPAARSGKHPGRVGDSPLVAAGTWADDATAAISCTGDGEAIIRDRARARDRRADAPRRARRSTEACERALGGLAPFGTGGLIAVGADGASPPRSRPPRCRAAGASATARSTSRSMADDDHLYAPPARGVHAGARRRREGDPQGRRPRDRGDRGQAAQADARRLDREPGRARAARADRGAARRGRRAARGPGRRASSGGGGRGLRDATLAERRAVDAVMARRRRATSPAGKPLSRAMADRLRTTLHAAAGDEALREALSDGPPGRRGAGRRRVAVRARAAAEPTPKPGSRRRRRSRAAKKKTKDEQAPSARPRRARPPSRPRASARRRARRSRTSCATRAARCGPRARRQGRRGGRRGGGRSARRRAGRARAGRAGRRGREGRGRGRAAGAHRGAARRSTRPATRRAARGAAGLMERPRSGSSRRWLN